MPQRNLSCCRINCHAMLDLRPVDVILSCLHTHQSPQRILNVELKIYRNYKTIPIRVVQPHFDGSKCEPYLLSVLKDNTSSFLFLNHRFNRGRPGTSLFRATLGVFHASGSLPTMHTSYPLAKVTGPFSSGRWTRTFWGIRKDGDEARTNVVPVVSEK